MRWAFLVAIIDRKKKSTFLQKKITIQVPDFWRTPLFGPGFPSGEPSLPFFFFFFYKLAFVLYKQPPLPLKNFTGTDMKAMRPPGCNGGVSSFFLSKLPRAPLYFCTQSTFLLFFDATQVCYCNHFHYCNDRHKVSLPPSDEKENKDQLHLFLPPGDFWRPPLRPVSARPLQGDRHALPKEHRQSSKVKSSHNKDTS